MVCLQRANFTKGFPCGLAGKESACNVGDLGLIPGLGRSPGEGKGYALQYSGLENSMDCIVHGVAKRRTQLSDQVTYRVNLKIIKYIKTIALVYIYFISILQVNPIKIILDCSKF